MNAAPSLAAVLRVIRRVDISLIAFVISACILAFFYGVTSYKYKLFPYALVREAFLALDAQNRLEAEGLMNGAELRADAAPRPVVTQLSARAGHENILVTGGPYQFMERCPRFGCVAWIINREGEVIHSWEVDLDALVSSIRGFAGNVNTRNVYPVGLVLDESGALYATFHARNAFPYQVGFARIEPDGAIAWLKTDHSHHWPTQAPDGLVYVPSMRQLEGQARFPHSVVDTRCEGVLYDDGVRAYRPDGEIAEEYWLGEILGASRYRGMLYYTRDACDPFHVNSVDIVTPSIAARSGAVEEGDLLISVRELGAIVVIDPRRRQVRTVLRGLFAAQHSARFLPDGEVLLFDNQGGDPALGGSRVLRGNLGNGETRALFPRPVDRQFLPYYAEERGNINVAPSGDRALVASGENGLIVEIDTMTGEPLWSMQNTQSIDPFLTERRINSEFRNARMTAYGAYYVSSRSVFSRPQ